MKPDENRALYGSTWPVLETSPAPVIHHMNNHNLVYAAIVIHNEI